jgi:hypothetical protein
MNSMLSSLDTAAMGLRSWNSEPWQEVALVGGRSVV